jgi:hypothetical protein
MEVLDKTFGALMWELFFNSTVKKRGRTLLVNWSG